MQHFIKLYYAEPSVTILYLRSALYLNDGGSSLLKLIVLFFVGL